LHSAGAIDAGNVKAGASFLVSTPSYDEPKNDKQLNKNKKSLLARRVL
jgi:hypothetical protein